ncbi:MAG: aa3-type cytochrome c oxidase subunit IV [Pseudomonadota bacterium]
MADHKHGDMNIDEQEKTFASFISWVTRISIGILIFLVLLAMING